MELVDILNEAGEKSYTFATREEAHLKALWHRNVGLFLSYQSNGEDYIIFSERSQLKKSFPGMFDLAASGHLSKGESSEDGCREFVEELGTTSLLEGLQYLADFKLINSYKIGDQRYYNREFLSLYFKKVSSLEIFTIDLTEIARLIAIKVVDLPMLRSGEVVPAFEGNPSLPFLKHISLHDFIPSDSAYIENILDKIINTPLTNISC